nr:hypothetical protein [Tanacetum cinerariifolium]
MSSFNQRECLGCSQPCDGYHYSCTCQQRGVILLNGICLNCIHEDGKPITCCVCEGPLRGGFCLFCDSKDENSYTYDPNAYSFNDTSSNFNHLPQPQLCGNNSHYAYDCQPQFPFVYEQEPSCNQNYNDNFYPHDLPSFLCCDNCGGSHATFQCQSMDQNTDSFGFDQIQPSQYPVIHHPSQEMSEKVFQAKGNLMKSIQTFLEKFSRYPFGVMPKYPDVHPPSQEISDEVFYAKGDLMKSIQTFLDEFNYIPFGEKTKISLEAWYKFFKIRHAQPDDSNELFQKLLEDLKELTEYNHLIFSDNDEDHSVQNKEYLENSSNEIAASNSNQEKEEPPQDFDIQLLCMHDNVDDLIESALNSKLLINSQRLNKEKQEVKNVVEQPAEHRTHTPILSTKEPEYSPSKGYEHPNTTLETKSDEIIKSRVEELVPMLSENEDTSEDKRECDLSVYKNSPICDNHSEIFSDSNNNDDISSDDDDFEDFEYIEASLSDPEIVIVEEENVVHQEEEEIDLEHISQIQDVDLREKLLSITHLIANIESLNDNPTPDRVLNSSVSIPIFEESNNSLSDNFSPELKTFCDHTEETRSGNTTTHADDSLPEYDSFCFEVQPDQERLINIVKNDISNDSSNDPLLEEADLFLAFDNSIQPSIENFTDDSEGDIHFIE